MKKVSILIGVAVALVSMTVMAAPEVSPKAKPGKRALVLREALADADRLEVTSTEEGPDVEAKAVIQGAEKIAALVASLDFDDKESGFHCMCDGDHLVTFFHGDKKMATLSHHHSLSLRWYDKRWAGDSLFKPGVSEAWSRWFERNGFPGFEKMRQEAIARAETDRKEQEDFMKPFPADARKVFDDLAKENDGGTTFLPGNDGEKSQSPSKSELRFLRACGGQEEAGVAICAALGSLTGSRDSGSWSSTTFREQLVIGAFSAIGSEHLPAIFEKASKDTKPASGAARLFFFEQISDRLPEPSRLDFAARLARQAALTESHSNAVIAFNRLEGMKSPDSDKLLIEVAGGTLKPGDVTHDEHDEEPGLRASAILLLARHGNDQVRALLDEASSSLSGKSDLAAVAISRAFLGDIKAIKPEHFRIESYTLGYAALACLERKGDRDALDLIITGGFDHPWGAVDSEAVLAVQRLTGKSWFHSQPNENEVWYMKDIRAWWTSAKADWKPLAPAP